jgi:hypothetical protein
MAKYMAYPATDDIRSGCKVGWRIYRDRVLAEACAVAARHNAEIKAEQGYDFGYCAPGSITVLDDGRFEVCIP